MLKEEYLKKEYWDNRASNILNQNLSFSDNINNYYISRKINIIEYLITQINPNCILDLGCGSGAILNPLVKKFNNIIFYAIDFSKENLKNIVDLPNVIKIKTDSWKIPLKDLKIDFLFCLDVFFHLTLIQKANTLSEIFRVSNKYYLNFRGEELSSVFYYEFMFRKLKIPYIIKDELVLFYTKRNELPLKNYCSELL